MLKIKPLSIIIHALVWLLLLVLPYVSTDQIVHSIDPTYNVKYLLFSLVLSSVLILVFYVNYLFLIPKYLILKKYRLYFAFLFTSIVIGFLLFSILFFFSAVEYETMAETLNTTNPIIEKIIPVVIINTATLWLLSIVLSILYTIYNRLKQTEREKLSAQIATLKSQINPHFLFNTLNSIYATAIDTEPQVAEMLAKLSEMMRYTMKDAQKDVVLLEDEINYIHNFIELQNMRLDKSILLEYDAPSNIPALHIAPMLLIPFIENAFKHGVNAEEKSQIKINLTLNKTELQLSVVNHKVTIQKDILERSGLGIENTKHRLHLMYPSKHVLHIEDTEKEFSVSLTIQLR